MRVEYFPQLQQPVRVLHVLNELLHVHIGMSPTAHNDLNGTLQQFLGQHLNVSWEGGREHDCLPIRPDNVKYLVDLRFEPKIEHPVGLIDDNEGDSP